jgi:cytoskeletal protein RodZ
MSYLLCLTTLKTRRLLQFGRNKLLMQTVWLVTLLMTMGSMQVTDAGHEDNASAIATPKFSFRPPRSLHDSAEKAKKQKLEGALAAQATPEKVLAENDKAEAAAQQPLPESEDESESDVEVKGVSRSSAHPTENGGSAPSGAASGTAAKENAPAAASGGWNQDFLKKNQAQAAAASAAAKEAIEAETGGGKAADMAATVKDDGKGPAVRVTFGTGPIKFGTPAAVPDKAIAVDGAASAATTANDADRTAISMPSKGLRSWGMDNDTLKPNQPVTFGAATVGTSQPEKAAVESPNDGAPCRLDFASDCHLPQADFTEYSPIDNAVSRSLMSDKIAGFSSEACVVCAGQPSTSFSISFGKPQGDVSGAGTGDPRPR